MSKNKGEMPLRGGFTSSSSCYTELRALLHTPSVPSLDFQSLPSSSMPTPSPRHPILPKDEVVSKVRVGALIKQHSSSILKQEKLSPGQLSERLSRIKARLLRDISLEKIDESVVNLNALLQDISTHPDSLYLKDLSTKCHYLKAACQFYYEVYHDAPSLINCRAAVNSLKLAQQSGFKDVLGAGETMERFYQHMTELRYAADAHDNRIEQQEADFDALERLVKRERAQERSMLLSNDLTKPPLALKRQRPRLVETSLLKSLGEGLFLSQYRSHRKHLLRDVGIEIPKRAKQILLHSLDASARTKVNEKGQILVMGYNTPR